VTGSGTRDAGHEEQPQMTLPDPVSHVPSPVDVLRHELARKAVHVSSAAVPAAYAAGYPRAWLLGALAALVVVAIAVEVTRLRHAATARLFTRLTGPMLRAHEHARWSGATWLLASFALAALLFPPAIAVAAMLAVSLGDASAAIVGRWAGVLRARRGASTVGKTWVGSAACATVTALAALLVAGLTPGASAAAGLAAAAAERPDWPVDDNVRVALAAGIAAVLWGML
jgi:phytol kinase